MPAMTFEKDAAQHRIILILAALNERPMSTRELADYLHMDRTGVPAYLKHIKARICYYVKPDGPGNLVPVYDMLPGPCKRRPKPQTKTEAKRAKWKRIKADPVRHARVLAQQAAGRLRKRDGWGGSHTTVIR